MTEVVSQYVLTNPVTMTFPDLFVPRQFKKNGVAVGEPKFGGQFVFDDPANHVDWAAMKKIAAEVARAGEPGVDLKTLAFPFQMGDKLADKRKAKGKSDGEWQRGKGVITARSKFQPELSVLEGGQIIDLNDEAKVAKYKARFYSGTLVYATFNFVYYPAASDNVKSGVTAYLNNVLSLNKGPRIGGSTRAGSDVFKGYAGKVSAEDPTGGDELDDEIPF